MYRYYKLLPVALFVLSISVFSSVYGFRGGEERSGGERFQGTEHQQSGQQQHSFGPEAYEHRNTPGMGQQHDQFHHDDPYFHGNPYYNQGSGTTVVVPDSYSNEPYDDIGGPEAGTNYFNNPNNVPSGY